MAKTLKDLQAKWYRKLAQSGFDDIENVNSPNEMLKQWHSSWFQVRYKNRPTEFEAKQRYYQLAEQMLLVKGPRRLSGLSRQERMIWQRHVKGMSTRQIARDTKFGRTLVNTVVRYLRKRIVP